MKRRYLQMSEQRFDSFKLHVELKRHVTIICRRQELRDVRQSAGGAGEDRRRHGYVRRRLREDKRQAARETVWHHEIPRPHVLP